MSRGPKGAWLTIAALRVQAPHTNMDVKEIVFSCCYCGDDLTDDTPDFVGVSIYDKDTGDGTQFWFAHETCFRERLHPKYNEIPGLEDFMGGDNNGS